MPPTQELHAQNPAFSPSPLVAEGLGGGGKAETSALRPLSPCPSSARREGRKGRELPGPSVGHTRREVHGTLLAGTATALLAGSPGWAFASGDEDLEKDSARALGTLYRQNPTAAAIGRQAKAILVFPKIVKAGLMVGGSYGEGVLMQGGRVTGHYNSVSASWGWQAGAQTYSYVLFLMTDAALRQMEQAKGWELGVGPTVVVVNEGVARNLSTQTLKDDVYAFISDQQGLMAGISIEGTKVTRLKR